MKEYRKIANLFKFDTKYKHIEGLNEPYKTLKDIKWIGTEKVDGTNVRVYWDGHKITLAGRTDNAQWQGDLYGELEKIFLVQEMEYIFEQVFGDKEAYVFGEGYGPKIQAGGGLYSDTPKFIVFDITIDGHELNRSNVEDVANKLGLDVVPVVFQGNLDEAQEFVADHQMSTLGNHEHEMEGLVLTPVVDIYDNKGNRIKCKCKYRDLLKH